MLGAGSDLLQFSLTQFIRRHDALKMVIWSEKCIKQGRGITSNEMLSCVILFSNKFIQITIAYWGDRHSCKRWKWQCSIVASKLVTNGCFINDRGHHILIYTVIISSKSPEGRSSQVHGRINKSRWNVVYGFHHLWTDLEVDNSNNSTVKPTSKWSQNRPGKYNTTTIRPYGNGIIYHRNKV